MNFTFKNLKRVLSIVIFTAMLGNSVQPWSLPSFDDVKSYASEMFSGTKGLVIGGTIAAATGAVYTVIKLKNWTKNFYSTLSKKQEAQNRPININDLIRQRPFDKNDIKLRLIEQEAQKQKKLHQESLKQKYERLRSIQTTQLKKDREATANEQHRMFDEISKITKIRKKLPLAQTLQNQGFDIAQYQNCSDSIQNRIDGWNTHNKDIAYRQKRLCDHLKKWTQNIDWSVINKFYQHKSADESIEQTLMKLRNGCKQYEQKFTKNEHCNAIIALYNEINDPYIGLSRIRLLNPIFGAHFNDAKKHVNILIARLECYKLLSLVKILAANPKDREKIVNYYKHIMQEKINNYKEEESKLVRLAHFGGIAKISWCDPVLFKLQNDTIESCKESLFEQKRELLLKLDSDYQKIKSQMVASASYHQEILQNMNKQLSDDAFESRSVARFLNKYTNDKYVKGGLSDTAAECYNRIEKAMDAEIENLIVAGSYTLFTHENDLNATQKAFETQFKRSFSEDAEMGAHHTLAVWQLYVDCFNNAIADINNQLDTTWSGAAKKLWSGPIIKEEKKELTDSIIDLGSCSTSTPVRKVLNEENELNKYIDQYLTVSTQSGLTKEMIYDMIDRGGSYAHKLFYADAADEIPTATPQEYLQSIIDLTWYFYSLAINKKQEFEEGTFMIDDPEWKLADFLMSYVYMRQDGDEIHEASPIAGSSNPFAYQRASSHLKHSQKKGEEFKHYGIDMRLNAQDWAQALLPAQKRHILFGKVAGKKRVFFKMENHGLYLADGLMPHAGEFIGSLGRKAFGGDDKELYRKERVPKDVSTFVQKLKPGISNYAQLSSLVKEHGIGALHNYITGWKKLSAEEKPGNAEWRNKIREEFTQLTRKYDNISQRIGREVILTDHDLARSSQYYHAIQLKQHNILPDLAQNYQQNVQNYPSVNPLTFSDIPDVDTIAQEFEQLMLED